MGIEIYVGPAKSELVALSKLIQTEGAMDCPESAS